jgi:hypothetical protein
LAAIQPFCKTPMALKVSRPLVHDITQQMRSLKMKLGMQWLLFDHTRKLHVLLLAIQFWAHQPILPIPPTI